MSDTVTIRLRFTVDTVIGRYSNVIDFTEDEWSKRDPAAIEVTKQALADDWVVFRSAQIAEEEALKTIEGKQAKIAALDIKIADLEATKAQLQSEIGVP